jgi:PAS domain S-box-containing protein
MTARQFPPGPAGVVVDRNAETHGISGVVLSDADDLSDAELAQWRAELLDPGSWSGILGQYGRIMHLAVALTDAHGDLLGECQNPQPIWNLVRRVARPVPGLWPVPEPWSEPESPRASNQEIASRQEPPSEPWPVPEAWKDRAEPACPFCLDVAEPCHAVRDALISREGGYAIDRAGLTHVTIPLFLGNQPLGTIMAGQALIEFPAAATMWSLSRLAGAKQKNLWHAAMRQMPASPETLRQHADLLASLGQAFLSQRYAAILGRKLHETNQRYRFMIEKSWHHALLTIDSSGFVTSWNQGAERLLGYPASEIVGQHYSRFFNQEDVREDVLVPHLRRLAERGWCKGENWWVRRDGTSFLSETVAARLEQGDVPEYGILLHDVTEPRSVAEAVLQAQKLESVGLLAGGIAHDFNNLLTGILGNVSLALDGLPLHHSLRPLLDIAEKSSLRGAALIAQLLSYVGHGHVTVTRFDLSALISEIIPLIHTSIPKAVRLTLDLSPDKTWMEADSSAIQQVVMNLVINAAEAIDEKGGVVVVSTGLASLDAGAAGTLAEGAEPDAICLEVRDSGSGMDEATKSRIFDPFFTTKFTGRGLGLAAVSGIVRGLKGRLDVYSVPGEGSTFRLIFPRAASSHALLPVEFPSPKPCPRPTGVVLVVDDDRLIRELATEMLRRSGFSVLAAENGREAVDLFRLHGETISAVLLDLTMPVMGGDEAFRLIKQIRPDVPVIIASGYGVIAIHQHLHGASASVIRKPYTMAELRAKIAAALGQETAGSERAGSEAGDIGKSRTAGGSS